MIMLELHRIVNDANNITKLVLFSPEGCIFTDENIATRIESISDGVVDFKVKESFTSIFNVLAENGVQILRPKGE